MTDPMGEFIAAGDPAAKAVDSAQLARRRRTKNIAVGLALVALAVLFYLITVVRIGGNL